MRLHGSVCQVLVSIFSFLLCSPLGKQGECAWSHRWISPKGIRRFSQKALVVLFLFVRKAPEDEMRSRAPTPIMSLAVSIFWRCERSLCYINHFGAFTFLLFHACVWSRGLKIHLSPWPCAPPSLTSHINSPQESATEKANQRRLKTRVTTPEKIHNAPD